MYIARTHLTMVNWRVMFCKIFSVIISFFIPKYSQFLKDFFVSQPDPLHIPCFGKFWFIPQITNPSVVELSVFRVVAGCLCSNAIKSGCMPISGFPLLNVPHVSASAAEDTTFQIVLHPVCMGPFLSVFGFIGLGEG